MAGRQFIKGGGERGGRGGGGQLCFGSISLMPAIASIKLSLINGLCNLESVISAQIHDNDST